MPVQLIAYLSTLVPFVILDAAWLTVTGSRIYKPVLGDILATDIRIAPIVAFYLVYPVGLVAFAVMPALKGAGLGAAALNAALFGAIAYATYDLTNYATLRNWTLAITLIDVAWGAVLAAVAATLSTWITAKFAGSA